MSTSRDDSWDQTRQSFADQFEEYGNGFVFRRSQKGEAIPVSAEERSRFIDQFDRGLRRSAWFIFIGMVVVVGGLIALAIRQGSDLSQGLLYGAMAVLLLPSVAYIYWIWAAPARALAGRTPIAGERSRDELLRLRFQRIRYGQLAIAGAAGLMLPLMGAARQDVFEGWGRLWLAGGTALVAMAVVQAFRKWRFEQEDSLRNVIPPQTRHVTAGQAGGVSGRRAKGQLRRYLVGGAIAGAIALVILTPAGKRLAQMPSFWPIVMVGVGGWALFSVARGFAQGEIEPFARGFYNNYERETQPKRFWASMAWNSVFGCFCLWIAFAMNAESGMQSIEHRCYHDTSHYAPEDALSACNQLIAQGQATESAYLGRGLAYLDTRKWDQAAADFTRAHELDPKSPWPLADRGVAYAWKSDSERASKDFDAVRAMDPSNPVLARGQALLDMQAGDLEKAISGLNVQLARDPSDLWSLAMRSDAYQQRGDFDKARADRDRIERLSRQSQNS